MLRYLENVVTLQLDAEKCNGCGMCVNVCPHAVLSIEEHRAAIIDKGACMECGACALNCPEKAIKVRTGVGCASAILRSKLGKKSECSGSCGVSPAESCSSENSCSSTK